MSVASAAASAVRNRASEAMGNPGGLVGSMGVGMTGALPELIKRAVEKLSLLLSDL